VLTFAGVVLAAAGAVCAGAAEPAATVPADAKVEQPAPAELAVDREKAIALANEELKNRGLAAKYDIGTVTLSPARDGVAPRWFVLLTPKATPPAANAPQTVIQKLPPRMVVTMDGKVSTLVPRVRGGPAGREPAPLPGAGNDDPVVGR
jgi:hypothetical protein